LYLGGKFPKEVLLDRQTRLEDTISALANERKALLEQLEIRSYSQEQIDTIQRFAIDASKGLETADSDFAVRRRIIETLDTQATLVVENNMRIAHVTCVLGGETLLIESNNTCRGNRRENHSPNLIHLSGRGGHIAPRR
jgi:hypothetical protein